MTVVFHKNLMPVVHPTPQELADLSEAANRLWSLDTNRIEPGKDYELDLQCCRGRNDGDVCSRPLFKKLDPAVLQRPTYKTFVKLLDNYSPFTGASEVVTADEVAENNAFLNVSPFRAARSACRAYPLTHRYDLQHTMQAIIQTDCIQYLGEYLVQKRKIKGTGDLKNFLNDLWFKLYKRDRQCRGAGDSSAFEHVFVGEISPDFKTRENIVKGFHNW